MIQFDSLLIRLKKYNKRKKIGKNFFMSLFAAWLRKNVFAEIRMSRIPSGSF